MKIGLITCHEVNNYGSLLMSYALQCKIEQFGYDCESINYVPKRGLHYLCAIPSKLLNKQLRASKRERMKKARQASLMPTLLEGLKERELAYRDFATKYLRLSPAFEGYKSLKEKVGLYAAVVLGSDQVWAPMNLEGGFKNMLFVPDRIRKIAYASSFGVSDIPAIQRSRTKRFLERIDHISVREFQGASIVEALTGRKAPVLIDPTLFFGKELWSRIMPERSVVEGDYIFSYLLGDQSGHREAVRKLKERTGLPVVALPHIDTYVESDEGYADRLLYSVGPEAFVRLIADAKFVCTDSFHGSVFSILYEKPFVTFERYRRTSSLSANSRVGSLLEQTGLFDRLYDGKDVAEQISGEIDYAAVKRKLEEMRTVADEFLNRALSGL